MIFVIKYYVSCAIIFSLPVATHGHVASYIIKTTKYF